MNLVCPNCQKMLTVPEQYAGQLMKCPLCAGTFTVPGLPPAAPSPAALPPSSAPNFGLGADAPPAPGAAPSPTPSTASPSSFAGTPPPSPPGGPFTLSIWFKPEIIQWIAPGALVLIVFLYLFFPWIGVYKGGQAAAWQYGWQILFGFWGEDGNLQRVFHMTTDKEIADGLKSNRPGFGFLMLLYTPLMLLAAAITVACAVQPLLKVKIPPNVEPLLKWRWAAVGVVILLLFLLLCVQMLWGFPLENSVYSWQLSDAEYQKLANKEIKETSDEMRIKVFKGEAAELVMYSNYLKLVFVLHLVALVAAGLMVALDRRGNRPPVRLDLTI
jgi:hypothetical protein